MIILKKAIDIINFLSAAKASDVTTGFVPTMGALHKGHISLITKAKTKNDFVIASIFINPAQFNDPKDFEKYPVTLEQDIYQLEKAGCTVLFLPTVDEVYPDGLNNLPHFELGYMETILDGKYRPGHFQGVCQLVHRLLQMVLPDKLYLGQKDFQQCLVLKKMMNTYYPSVQIEICPTLRESDGLAMSSRNIRLCTQERLLAAEIYATLQQISNNSKCGNTSRLKKTATQYLTAKGFKVDYVELANANSLKPVNNWDGKEKIVALIAAFLNEIRLIDNMIVND